MLDADEPVPDAFLRQARQRGLEVSRTWQFPSMVSAGDGAQLAALKAVEPGYRCAALRVAEGPFAPDAPARGIPSKARSGSTASCCRC